VALGSPSGVVEREMNAVSLWRDYLRGKLLAGLTRFNQCQCHLLVVPGAGTIRKVAFLPPLSHSASSYAKTA